jgi:hypothetical protein
MKPPRFFARAADNKNKLGMRGVAFLTGAVLAGILPLRGTAKAQAPAAPSRLAFCAIRGSALNVDATPLPDSPIRLRDARSGRFVATSSTDKTGSFTFSSVDPGSYVIEVLGGDGNVVAASQILNLNAGDAASAIVKLPFQTRRYSGVLGHTVMSAILVTSAAAASGILATEIVGEQKSPRQ